MSLKNLFRNLSSLARADVSTFTSSMVTASAAASTMAGKLAVPGALRPLESSVMAYACLVCRREAIGGREPLVTDGQNNVLESSTLGELIARPTAAMDWDQWVRALETHLSLHNACAVHILADPSRPELEPLHVDGLRPRMGVYAPAGTPRVVGYDYVDPTTGMSRNFQPDEIVIRTGYNPHAPLSTLSPLKVLERTLKGDIAAREQNLALFQNDATPRGYLTTEAGTREQMESVLDVWNKVNQGYLNRHKTAALWGGVDYKAIQLSPAELEFMESLKFMRMDYYMAFRVYPAMLQDMMGETGLSQGSSTDSQRVAWWEDVGCPELDLIAGIVNEAAKKLGITKEFLWFNEAAIPALARQRLSKVDTFVKTVGMGYRPDEVNEFLDLGLPKHPDNLGRVAFALAPIGAKSSEFPVQSSEFQAKEEKGEQSRAEMRARVDRLGEAIARAEKDEKKFPAKWAAARAAFDAFVMPLERQAATRWSRFYVEQRGRLLERIAKQDVGLARAAGVAGLVLARAEVSVVIERIFPRAAEDAALMARLTPLLTENLKAGTDYFAKETGLPALSIDQDPEFAEALASRSRQALLANDTTEDDLRNLWRAALDEGDDSAQFADRVAEYYKAQAIGETAMRPVTAARTMTAAMVNEGRLLSAKRVGGLRKTWIHSELSGEDRPAHVEAMSRYAGGIGLDEKFSINGYECEAPGDASLPASEVCNCRCMLGYVPGEGDAQ
jgi:hypothetical protein